EARSGLVRGSVVPELRRIARQLEAVSDALRDADGGARHAEQWRWAVDARIASRAAALSKAMDEAGAVYLPQRLHGLRIAAKDLRSAIEIGCEASGESAPAELSSSKRAQRLLGRLHDLHVLIDCVRRVQGSGPEIDFAGRRELSALGQSLEDVCRRLH